MGITNRFLPEKREKTENRSLAIVDFARVRIEKVFFSDGFVPVGNLKDALLLDFQLEGKTDTEQQVHF